MQAAERESVGRYRGIRDSSFSPRATCCLLGVLLASRHYLLVLRHFRLGPGCLESIEPRLNGAEDVFSTQSATALLKIFRQRPGCPQNAQETSCQAFDPCLRELLVQPFAQCVQAGTSEPTCHSN